MELKYLSVFSVDRTEENLTSKVSFHLRRPAAVPYMLPYTIQRGLNMAPPCMQLVPPPQETSGVVCDTSSFQLRSLT